MQKNSIQFSGLAPFRLQITDVTTCADSPENVFDQHVHGECEIYINLSGDVEFMVEDHIYPISPGSVIITKPYENHHCIYKSNAVHKHFWILFSCEGNEELFRIFFCRRAGEGNLIALNGDAVSELNENCRMLLKEGIPPLEQYFCFFRLIQLLSDGTMMSPTSVRLSPEVIVALDLIHERISETISVKDLADYLHISVSTFERKFKKNLGLTPRAYIFKRKLALAAALLAQGGSVKEVCERCGFSDDSNFIVLFRRNFGMTPLKYKKQFESAGRDDLRQKGEKPGESCHILRSKNHEKTTQK